MPDLRGLATGIGSLPQKDAQSALDLIFKYLPQIPFWPQLPKRDIREGMVAQFSENLPCIKVNDKGVTFKPQDEELEEFYARIIAGDVDYFKITPEFALGLHEFYQRLEKIDLSAVKFIKCHVVGPFTYAAAVKGADGVAILHNPVFMQAIIKGLAMKALWQVELFRKFGKKIIIFFDEPYLGCFGSAYTPINREAVIKGFTELIQPLESADVLVGVHCCGNTDWSMLSEIHSIDIISFDAWGFLDRLVLYAENLKGFFKREGTLCWGIVPTSEFSDQLTLEFIIDKLQRGVETMIKKGMPSESVWKNMFLSPSCGLGSLDEYKVSRIFGILNAISKKCQPIYIKGDKI